MKEKELQYQREWNMSSGMVINIPKRMLDRNMKQYMTKICAEQDRSLSYIARDAVRQYLLNYQKNND